MPVCDGCGGSYLDDFNFCPHCGRSKPKPATMHLVVESVQPKYEFGEIHVVYTGRHEIQVPGRYGNVGWGMNGWKIPFAWLAYRLVSWNANGMQVVAAESKSWRNLVSYFGDDDNSSLQEYAEKIKTGTLVHPWFAEFVSEYPKAYSEFDARIQADGWVRFENDKWGGPKQIVPELDPMDTNTFDRVLPQDVLEKAKSRRQQWFTGNYRCFPYDKAIERLQPPYSRQLERYKRRIP